MKRNSILDAAGKEWDDGRYRVWSLSDVLDFYARDFLRSVELLETMKQRLLSVSIQGQLTAEDAAFFANNLRVLHSHCSAMKLSSTLMQLSRIQRRLSTGSVSDDEFADLLKVLQERIDDELRTRVFYCVAQENLSFYEECPTGSNRLQIRCVEHICGTKVFNAFPSTHYDFKEAIRCRICVRDTACVFHMMRVLESGLNVLAGRFGVPFEHTNWHNVIEGIEKEVRGMGSAPNRQPDWKEQQEFFSRAASHFMFLKDAWRNYTAHARGSYTPEEAESIFRNVSEFMQKLASRLSEHS
jgi:hypothetical protein